MAQHYERNSQRVALTDFRFIRAYRELAQRLKGALPPVPKIPPARKHGMGCVTGPRKKHVVREFAWRSGDGTPRRPPWP